jgi:hypothetical protein
MRELHGKIESPYVVDEDTSFHGMICGNTIVKDSVTFDVHGMITADLTVEMGGIANIHGMVNGTVYNNGGQVTIWGMVDSLVDARGSMTTVEPGAVIRDRQPQA